MRFTPSLRSLLHQPGLRTADTGWPELIYRSAWEVEFDSGAFVSKPLGLDSVYNISYSYDGESFFFTRRKVLTDEENSRFYQAIRKGDAWEVVDISERDSIFASYAHQVKDGSIYFFQSKGESGSGLYRAQWNGSSFDPPEWLGAEISEPDTTSFSPFVAANESWMIYTVYYEDASMSNRNGFYLAKNIGGSWEKQHIEALPYGWNASTTPDRKYFIFTDGDDIYRCMVKDLGISFE